MDYRESKIKNVIREAFFLGANAQARLVRTNNPYATLNEDLAAEANEVTDRAFSAVEKLK